MAGNDRLHWKRSSSLMTAAPSDYFGNKLRTDADAEQASCTELAMRLAEREKNPDDFEPLRRLLHR